MALVFHSTRFRIIYDCQIPLSTRYTRFKRPTSRPHIIGFENLLQVCMDYYHCSIEELHQELQRRNYMPVGNRDQLSESLRADDDLRGSEATTVKTDQPISFAPRDVNLMRTAEFGQSVPATQLIDQSTGSCDDET